MFSAFPWNKHLVTFGVDLSPRARAAYPRQPKVGGARSLAFTPPAGLPGGVDPASRYGTAGAPSSRVRIGHPERPVLLALHRGRGSLLLASAEATGGRVAGSVLAQSRGGESGPIPLPTGARTTAAQPRRGAQDATLVTHAMHGNTRVTRAHLDGKTCKTKSSKQKLQT